MTLLPLLVAAGLSQTAVAGKDGVGLRLKVNSDLFQVQSGQGVFDGEEDDDANGKTTTIGLFNTTPRFEATYSFTPAIEAGLVLGYATAKTMDNDEFDSQMVTRRIGITGAYNVKVSDGMRFYAQPLFIMGRADSKDEDGESLGGASSMTYGLNAGLRIRLVKGATFDPAFEYLMGTGRALDDNGESTPNDETYMKYSSFGLKAGISVKF